MSLNPHWHEYITDWVVEQREGVGGSSRTNLYREWSSCSCEGRRGQIHVTSWPDVVGLSSCLGMTDPHQPSLSWPGSRPHTSNCVLITVVTQGAVGLEKSWAASRRERWSRAWRVRRRRAGWVAVAVGRVWVLWICLVRNRICLDAPGF
jgi:hypothetical protein